MAKKTSKDSLDKTNELKGNVIDEVTYTKKEVRIAWVKLILGLWGVFFASLLVLFLLTRHIIPC
ncbi:MAG: hypothetical protein LUC24_03230 [Bacteroidales bacterium]|nr:hypothetical protein [Bacteroidales bacterium]